MDQEYEVEVANSGEVNPWYILGGIEGKLATGQTITAADYSNLVRRAKMRAKTQRETEE